MKNMQTLNGSWQGGGVKIAKVFALSLAASLLLVLSGCQNPVRPPAPAAPEAGGMGTFSLTIGEEDLARTPTVRPPGFSREAFDRFDLDFTRHQWCNTFNQTVSVEDWQIGAPVSLPAGRWVLLVTAFIDGDVDVAQGRISDFTVTAGQTVDGNVMLAPIPFHSTNFPHRGELHWDIQYEGLDLTLARMELTRIYPAPIASHFTVHFIGGLAQADNPGYWPLGVEAGQYRAVITLQNSENALAVISTIVHVYRDMTSTVEFVFTEDHFQVPLLDVILGLWDLEPDLQDTFYGTGIAPGHFALLDVNGVTADNIGGLACWFDYFREELTPTNLAGLRTLVDVARLGVYSQNEDFLAVAHDHRGAATAAISALRSSANGNNTAITGFRWTGDRTVEVQIAGVLLEFEFANDIPVGMRVPYTTLADQLLWLRNNSMVGNTYIVEVIAIAPETITSTAAALPSRAITVVLTSSTAATAHVSLSGIGSLFTIPANLTLELGNVTLHGVTNNTASLINVQTNGRLIMREGSTVRGNNNTWATAGGVNVANGGRFILDGGTIASNTGEWNAGGVNVANGGQLRIISGVIYGSDADEDLRNTASPSGASLFVGTGNPIATAQFGTFDPSGEFGEDAYWQSNGNFTTTNATVRVENGELVRPEGDLDEQIAWLMVFAQAGGTYDIVISEDAELTPQSLVFSPVRNNVTFTLIGYEPGATVSLAATTNGSLFTIGSGVTLVLDDITLEGRNNNNAPVVQVNSGGNLRMEAGSGITGNVNPSGTGGGVNIASGGIFTMLGGRIFGNTAWGGGSVNVASGGTFRMVNGVIFGGDADEGLRNTVASGQPFSVSGTAQRGTIDDFGTFVPFTPNLTSNNLTLRVEEGVLLQPEGGNLVEQLAWLRTHAQSNQTYTIDLDGTVRAVTPTQASLAFSNSNVTIVLTSYEPSTVSLSANGNMFVIGSGHTLVLDGNVTLMGRGPNATPVSTANNTHLVRVDTGGTLLMKDGAITGNTSPTGTGVNEGGGMRVNGAFTMYGGTISGNTTVGTNRGGGVHIAGTGTFNMRGGTISGNQSGGNGGGVFNNGGTFRISTGLISSNTAPSNTGALSGASTVEVPIEAGGFVPAGWALPANVNVNIDIEDGVWQGATYTVTFNANNGDGTFDITIPAGLGSTITIPAGSGLSRPDSIFIGWNTEADGTGIARTVGSTYTPTGNTTLFARWMPVGDIAGAVVVYGDTLAERWTWLETDSQPGGSYLIVVEDDDVFASRTLPANITVILRGSQPSTTIGLSSTNASLFTIGSGSTLMLGENITLLGRGPDGVPGSSSIAQPLVRVNSGGTLIMNQGSRISGNTNTTSTAANMGGGVHVASGGTFHMFDGAISGNTVWNNGGGVYVANAGTFNMRGGTIYGNAAASQGGGVFIIAGGNFRISDGMILGSDAAEGANTTATSNGASLHGTASVGTFDGAGLFVESTSWTLPTTNVTIDVENGEWQNETFTVTFNSNGGTGTVPALSVPAGLGIAITIPGGGGLSRPGYVFAGWNTATDGTGTAFTAGTTHTPTANMALYARWVVDAVRNLTVHLRGALTDSWHGGSALRISVNGVDRSPNVTIANATANTVTFDADVGSIIRVYWVSGSHPNECAFAIWYTDNPPSITFNPSTGTPNDTSRFLLYRLYGGLNLATGTLLGTFTVGQ